MKPQFYVSLGTLLLVITLSSVGRGCMAQAQSLPCDLASRHENDESGSYPRFVDEFSAIQNIRVEPGKNETRTAEEILETLRMGGIRAGVENDDMDRCFNEHLEEEECFGITNTWSLCMPGLIVERHTGGDGLFLMDWRVDSDVLNLYENHVLKSMYACYNDGKWQLDTEDLSCAALGTRPDWSLCQQGDSTSLEDLCATITENDLIQISQRNESCAMWEAREIFLQFDKDFDQFLKSECGLRTERLLKRRHRIRHYPITLDRALYFQMAAGFPTGDFHLEYHGVKEIAYSWNFWNTSDSLSDDTKGCRPYLKQLGYTALESSLVYGRCKSTSDVARVKFRGTVTDPRFYASGQCYSATSNNQVVPACNQYGCIMSTSGTVAQSVWCDMSSRTAPSNGKEGHYQEALEWLDCNYLQ